MSTTESNTEQKPILAAALTVLASSFVAGTTLLAKALGTDALGTPLNALQVSQGRFLFAFMAISLAVAVLRPKFTRPAIGTHILRSTLGWGGVTLMFAAAAFIPLSDATAISFLNPVFGMLFAIPFLGEKVGPWRWLSASIAIAGAIVLMRPTSGVLEFGALLALSGAVLLGVEVTVIKKLTNREGPLQILWVNNLIGLCISTTVASFVWISPSPMQWAALAGVGLLMAAAQSCFVNAVRLGDASFVAPFFYTTLVFAALYDGVIFGVIPDAVSYSGSAMILLSAALLAWRETKRTKVQS
ncbi:DMT family transporter [Cognatishimia activa]|uniref:DMT family transporter n=1 Tax=Cognatishimia activa TaxID=1715691 RepID=UPI002230D513|nr:DMT family transporter [Cognatishimia activa]UZD89818.1 DMT family transporter [Cognatishimia activa]